MHLGSARPPEAVGEEDGVHVDLHDPVVVLPFVVLLDLPPRVLEGLDVVHGARREAVDEGVLVALHDALLQVLPVVGHGALAVRGAHRGSGVPHDDSEAVEARALDQGPVRRLGHLGALAGVRPRRNSRYQCRGDDIWGEVYGRGETVGTSVGVMIYGLHVTCAAWLGTNSGVWRCSQGW